MNVLVAGNTQRAQEIDRALNWARSCGAKYCERYDQLGSTVALAFSGGTSAQWHQDENGATARLGLTAILPENICGHKALPASTAAAAVYGGHAIAAVGPGNQRLFVHSNERGALISSHIGAIAAGLGSELQLDRSREDFLLGFGFLPDRCTIYKDVFAIDTPGRFDLTNGKHLNPTPNLPSTEFKSPDETPDLAQLVCEIVDQQAGDATSVGVLLGGFDSALVAAALRRTGRDVYTFTFNFAERGYEQRNVAAFVRNSGIEHHPVLISPEMLGDALWNLPARLNQPSPQPHYQLHTILAAEAARDAGVEVLFSGDGCDALFASYPTINTRAAILGWLNKVPNRAKRVALSTLSLPWCEHRLGHVVRMGRSALRASLLPGNAGRHLPTQYLDEVALRRLRGEDSPKQAESIEGIRMRLAKASALSDPARLAVDGNTLTGQSSSKVEGVVARSGLPVLSPYTHPRFRAVINKLPEYQRRPAGSLAAAEGKPILQEAALAAGLLPEKVIYQAKQSPTEAPIDQWYSGPLRPLIKDLLEKLPFTLTELHLNELLRPKIAENVYRSKVTLSKHVFQAVGLLASYASFTRLVR